MGNGSHAEGYSDRNGNHTIYALWTDSHAKGNVTTASGSSCHTKGEWTIAGCDVWGYALTHAEEGSTTITGYRSYAEGYGTRAPNSMAHVEGYYTLASGQGSYDEGYSTSSNYIQDTVIGSQPEGYATPGASSLEIKL